MSEKWKRVQLDVDSGGPVWMFGPESASVEHFDGDIGDVMVFETRLSDKDVAMVSAFMRKWVGVFTREDVELLRNIADEWVLDKSTQPINLAYPHVDRAAIVSLADRIEALLPAQDGPLAKLDKIHEMERDNL